MPYYLFQVFDGNGCEVSIIDGQSTNSYEFYVGEDDPLSIQYTVDLRSAMAMS